MAAIAVVPDKSQFGPRPKPETAEAEIDWTAPTMRGIALAHAAADCALCHGAGLIFGLRRIRACDCVYRAIFRAVIAQRLKRTEVASMPLAHLTTPGPRTKSRGATWGWKKEEFRADVDLIARRELNEEDYRIFRLRWFRRLDAKQIGRIVQRSRGDVFHHVFAIEKGLGRRFLNVQPYALYPIDEYFAGKLPTGLKRKAAA